MRKNHTHALIGDERNGPTQCPVCDDVVSSNYRTSHFIPNIIKPIINKAEEPCTSTEDLLRRIEQLIESGDLGNCIIESMDRAAFYPSINIDFLVDRCVEMIPKSSTMSTLRN